MLAVANKQVDVATGNTEDLQKLERLQPARAANIRAIWQSPIIPADPLVWRKDLSPALKDKIKAFFVDYGRERPGADVAHERKVLADLGGWGGWIAGSNAQLLPVRQVALFKDRLTVEANTTMSAEEKAKKTSELDAQLKALDAEMARVGS